MSEENIKKKSLLSVGFGEEIPNFFFVFFLKGFLFFRQPRLFELRVLLNV
jgi:hypothetical protein